MRFNEGIDIKIVYCDDTPSEYIDDVTMNDIYDILDSSSDICKIVDVSGSKKKVVWTDEYGFEKAYKESKKSAKKSLKESTEITEPRMAWISLLNHVCNFSTTIHSDSLWKALKKNPREEITLDEFVDECEKFVDMTKIRGMIEDYLGNDKQIEDNLKMYGLWNFSDKFAESLKEKIDTKYKKVFDHRNDEYEIMRFDDYNFQVIAVPNDKSLFSKDVPSLNVEKAYIYDTCKNATDVTLFVGIVEELGWCFIAFDKLANNDNIFAYYISGKDKHDAYMAFHEYQSEFGLINESKKSVKKSLKEEMDTSVVGTNKDKTKKYAYDFLKEWYDKIVVESLMNDDGDYVLKVGFYDDTLKKRPDVMDIVSAKLSGNSKFLQMLDNDTACKLVVYDVNNPRKYSVYWL